MKFNCTQTKTRWPKNVIKIKITLLQRYKRKQKCKRGENTVSRLWLRAGGTVQDKILNKGSGETGQVTWNEWRVTFQNKTWKSQDKKPKTRHPSPLCDRFIRSYGWIMSRRSIHLWPRGPSNQWMDHTSRLTQVLKRLSKPGVPKLFLVGVNVNVISVMGGRGQSITRNDMGPKWQPVFFAAALYLAMAPTIGLQKSNGKSSHVYLKYHRSSTRSWK